MERSADRKVRDWKVSRLEGPHPNALGGSRAGPLARAGPLTIARRRATALPGRKYAEDRARPRHHPPRPRRGSRPRARGAAAVSPAATRRRPRHSALAGPPRMGGAPAASSSTTTSTPPPSASRWTGPRRAPTPSSASAPRRPTSSARVRVQHGHRRLGRRAEHLPPRHPGRLPHADRARRCRTGRSSSSIKPSSGAFGIAKAFDSRLRGQTFIGFIQRFAGDDGEVGDPLAPLARHGRGRRRRQGGGRAPGALRVVSNVSIKTVERGRGAARRLPDGRRDAPRRRRDDPRGHDHRGHQHASSTRTR